jgi:hypothetical protein
MRRISPRVEAHKLVNKIIEGLHASSLIPQFVKTECSPLFVTDPDYSFGRLDLFALTQAVLRSQ